MRFEIFDTVGADTSVIDLHSTLAAMYILTMSLNCVVELTAKSHGFKCEGSIFESRRKKIPYYSNLKPTDRFALLFASFYG